MQRVLVSTIGRGSRRAGKYYDSYAEHPGGAADAPPCRRGSARDRRRAAKSPGTPPCSCSYKAHHTTGVQHTTRAYCACGIHRPRTVHHAIPKCNMRDTNACHAIGILQTSPIGSADTPRQRRPPSVYGPVPQRGPVRALSGHNRPAETATAYASHGLRRGGNGGRTR